MKTTLQAGPGFDRLVDIIRTLRGDNGCPWDREQDETTILNFFLEEVYEAVEAVQSGKTDAVREELGDVLMEVVFLARIYEEKGAFNLAESLESINHKLVQRHPHVFGGKKIDSSRQVLEDWHRQKLDEKKRTSLLDGLPRSLPALAAAFQIGTRASSVGFDWKQPEGALAKICEETAELGRSLEAGDRETVVREVGDLLFAVVNVARKAGINPETALLRANGRFRERFAYIETRLREQGKDPAQASPEEMDALWEEAKARGID